MVSRCRDDNDIREARRLAEATRPIRDRAGDPRGCHIESKNAIAIEVQNRLEPCGQISALTPCALTP